MSTEGDCMIKVEEDRYTLAIPVEDALAFAMGMVDLGYTEPTEGLRRIIGTIALDELEYAEHWRVAGLARICLAEKWPGYFTH